MDNSIYKVCEVCGQTKHISEFSKSYPRRCKACVAEHTRMVRSDEKNKKKRMLIKWDGHIDWEQRRYELAKEIMKGLSANPNGQIVDAEMKTLARWSVGGADALIAELKKGGCNESD